jgi:hypothetical protein
MIIMSVFSCIQLAALAWDAVRVKLSVIGPSLLFSLSEY